jgi:fatty-acyl-CoA synthase
MVALKDADRNDSYTYLECYEKTNYLAKYLQENHSILKGDRVAVLSENRVEHVLLLFALQKIGAILVPLNFRLAPPEIYEVLKDAAPKLIVYQKEYVEKIKTYLHQFPTTTIPIDSTIEKEVSLRYLQKSAPFAVKFAPTEQLTDAFSLPCMILYTSGTTGTPKGVIITNKMIFWNSINTSLRLNLTKDDSTVAFLPFFHTGGWHVLLTPLLHQGASVVLTSRFDPQRVLRLTEENGATIIFGVPTTLDMMRRTEEFNQFSFSKVRFAIVGGEPMSEPLINDWQEKGIAIRQGYGLTEYGPNVFSLSAEDCLRKIGSIGFPNFYVQMRLIDAHGVQVDGVGTGELQLRGPTTTPGYWNNAGATEALFHDGWLCTGDIISKDAEGYCYVIGRKKDMYISGGENVYPAEVERALKRHPYIRDTAVVGVYDDKWGEVGKAFVVLENDTKLDGDTLGLWCRGQLAKFKVPQHWRFVDELPINASGKILKRALIDTERAENRNQETHTRSFKKSL